MQVETNISNRSVRTLVEGLLFPEGPAFARDGSLWAVELKGESLIQLKDGELVRHHVGGGPNGLAVARDGKLFFCDSVQSSIRSFDPVSGATIEIAKYIGKEILNKPNDLAFDGEGNLVFTCPGESRHEPTGYACVLMKDGSIRKITSGKFFPNGVAFTPDRQFLVMAETYKHRLWKGKWNAITGEWREEKVWCETGGPSGPGGPDGLAYDLHGNLFVAVYGTGRIKMIDSEGTIVDEIQLPGLNPTNCAFDPLHQNRLVVTEAEKGTILRVDI